MNRLLLPLLIILSLPTRACDIVYGNDWGFMVHPPQHWQDSCSSEDGLAVSLWPDDQAPQQSETLIYITVSQKQDFPNIKAFALDEIERFRQEPYKPNIKLIKPPSGLNITTDYEIAKATYFNLTNHYENILYIASPDHYFIITITTTAKSNLEKYRKDFINYANSFHPVAVSINNNLEK